MKEYNNYILVGSIMQDRKEVIITCGCGLDHVITEEEYLKYKEFYDTIPVFDCCIPF